MFGGRVTRYDPDGKVDRVIALPVPQVTSCAFGGKDLDTLYITTASIGIFFVFSLISVRSSDRQSAETTIANVLQANIAATEDVIAAAMDELACS